MWLWATWSRGRCPCHGKEVGTKWSSNPRHSMILWLSLKTWIASLLESKDWAGRNYTIFSEETSKNYLNHPWTHFPRLFTAYEGRCALPRRKDKYMVICNTQCVFMLTVLKCLLCEPSVFHTFPVLPVTSASVEAPMFLTLFAFLLSPAGSCSFARAAAVSEHQLHSQAEPHTLKATRAVLCCTVLELF